VEVPLWTVAAQLEPRPPGPDVFKPVPFEADVDAPAAPAMRGDALVLRVEVERADGDSAYQPNGQGDAQGGRTPWIDAP
jgi:hypothetical protein